MGKGDKFLGRFFLADCFGRYDELIVENVTKEADCYKDQSAYDYGDDFLQGTGSLGILSPLCRSFIRLGIMRSMFHMIMLASASMPNNRCRLIAAVIPTAFSIVLFTFILPAFTYCNSL